MAGRRRVAIIVEEDECMFRWANTLRQIHSCCDGKSTTYIDGTALDVR